MFDKWILSKIAYFCTLLNFHNMAKTEHYYVRFQPGCYYHIFNRSVDQKPLFVHSGNYEFFLKKYDAYISPVATTYSYALLNNHFHFGIKVHTEEGLTTFQKVSNPDLDNKRPASAHYIVAHQFQKFFQCYAMAFNKQQSRSGTLFQTPFKRCAIDPDADLMRLILYHHINPQKHGLAADFRDYPWTSYTRYLSNRPTKLPRGEVFDLFGGQDKFNAFHLMAWMEMEERFMIEE